MAKKPLRTVRNSDFSNIYFKLLSGDELSVQDSATLLEAAVYFLNRNEGDLADLGYRIIVLHSNLMGNYEPLYDVANYLGLVPVAEAALKEIERRRDSESRFITLFQSSVSELNRRGNALFSDQQIELEEFVREGEESDLVMVAPTSYGKSQLITDFCTRNPQTNICIVVPTKALIAQTRRRLLENLSEDDRRPVLTHPESYRSEIKSFVAVFTQERLLRFLTEHPTAGLDHVIVDEAHNLLEMGDREVLLSQVLILARSKFPELKFQFYTPFLVDPNNLKLRHAAMETRNFKVEEKMKTERFYKVNYPTNRELRQYDPYFDKLLVSAEEVPDTLELFIEQRSSEKNIIYINSPKKIEIFARNFCAHQKEVDSEEIDLVCKSISDYIHQDYNLVSALRAGLVYHHGSIPDLVKLYVEDAFSRIDKFRWIVCSSTLLEGVNIPAQTMFLLDIAKGRKHLSKSQFKNLIGRVCRFSEVFNPDRGSLKLLEPKIYLVENDIYMRADTNVKKFLKSVAQVDLSNKEVVTNVLLQASDEREDTDSRQDADRMLQNLSPGIVDDSIEIASTDFGKIAFRNNLHEIDISENEREIEQNLSSLTSRIGTPVELLDEVARIFVPYLRDGSSYDSLRRLEESAARNFYAMFLDWRMQNSSFSEMIGNFLRYWEQPQVGLVYVGKWGDTARDGSFRDHWVNIKAKSPAERTNLAIVRIKEEQDFVDNFIMKFAETLNELKVLETEFFLMLKFGTSDQEVIKLINSGYNSHLAHLLIDEYSEFRIEDEDFSSVYLDSGIIQKMRENGENDIVVFEAKMHIRNQ